MCVLNNIPFKKKKKKANKRVASSPSNMKMLYFSESEIITEVQVQT